MPFKSHLEAARSSLVVSVDSRHPIRALTRRIERRVLALIRNDRFLPLQIDITNLCNLRCVHCYHPNHKNDGALALNEWLSVLDQYDALLTRIQFDPYLIICGGEPLLSPMLGPILKHVRDKKRNYRLSILTNGTLADRFDFSQLSGFEQVNFQVSLDGPDAVSHEKVRGKGSFDRSLRGIRAIQSNGRPVALLAVLSKRNAGLIPEFFDLAKSLGVESMDFTRLIVQGIAKDLVNTESDRVLEPLELKEAFRTILFESARTGVPSSPQKPLFRLLHPKLGRSGRFGEGLVVDHRGNILASSRSRLIIGHVFKDGLEQTLLDHPLLQAIRRGDVEACGRCPYFRRCGGDRNAAYAHTGNYLGPDPGCWLEVENNNNEDKQITVRNLP